MEANFFFQESFFSVIQAKVVQFLTYWKQNVFFRKIKKNFSKNYFLNLHVPGRVHGQHRLSDYCFFKPKKVLILYSIVVIINLI